MIDDSIEYKGDIWIREDGKKDGVEWKKYGRSRTEEDDEYGYIQRSWGWGLIQIKNGVIHLEAYINTNAIYRLKTSLFDLSEPEIERYYQQEKLRKERINKLNRINGNS